MIRPRVNENGTDCRSTGTGKEFAGGRVADASVPARQFVCCGLSYPVSTAAQDSRKLSIWGGNAGNVAAIIN